MPQGVRSGLFHVFEADVVPPVEQRIYLGSQRGARTAGLEPQPHVFVDAGVAKAPLECVASTIRIT